VQAGWSGRLQPRRDEVGVLLAEACTPVSTPRLTRVSVLARSKPCHADAARRTRVGTEGCSRIGMVFPGIAQRAVSWRIRQPAQLRTR